MSADSLSDLLARLRLLQHIIGPAAEPDDVLLRFALSFRPTATGCWLWVEQVDCWGYGRLYVGRGGVGKMQAHRYAYALAHGPAGSGAHVHHSCDEKRCVCPMHLVARTPGAHRRAHRIY
ncbi:MAG: HNH endonuclease [Gemmataceae bacterium]|nr:HNH endonuclease [Gemmataceae bacterium]